MIAPQKYLWTSMGNRSKLRYLRFLFEKCDITESELVMLLEPVKEQKLWQKITTYRSS